MWRMRYSHASPCSTGSKYYHYPYQEKGILCQYVAWIGSPCYIILPQVPVLNLFPKGFYICLYTVVMSEMLFGNHFSHNIQKVIAIYLLLPPHATMLFRVYDRWSISSGNIFTKSTLLVITYNLILKG